MFEDLCTKSQYRSVTHGIISKNDVQRLVERSEEPYAKIESSNGSVCLERCEKTQMYVVF